ncbi:hypothetical protein DPX16_14603 [Anabarilius grahami]|uniref:Uncharacterized protein n=1 Tax=Anabarilius grahami TaxID=495550 RepID=A0A3N0YYH6_ANAGA|nr:hypothetical protein DPX16_14603 [Anabarilius grahami]
MLTEEQTKNMDLAAVPSPITSEDLLLSLAQDGHPLEDYVEEFLELSHLVSWNNGTLKTCFWSGLYDRLFQPLPVGDTTCILAQYIDYAFWLSGSPFTVGKQTTTFRESPEPTAYPESEPAESELNIVEWSRPPSPEVCLFLCELLDSLIPAHFQALSPQLVLWSSKSSSSGSLKSPSLPMFPPSLKYPWSLLVLSSLSLPPPLTIPSSSLALPLLALFSPSAFPLVALQAPLSHWLRLGQSSPRLHHGHPRLRLRLVPLPLRLHRALPFLWLHRCPPLWTFGVTLGLRLRVSLLLSQLHLSQLDSWLLPPSVLAGAFRCV